MTISEQIEKSYKSMRNYCKYLSRGRRYNFDYEDLLQDLVVKLLSTPYNKNYNFAVWWRKVCNCVFIDKLRSFRRSVKEFVDIERIEIPVEPRQFDIVYATEINNRIKDHYLAPYLVGEVGFGDFTSSTKRARAMIHKDIHKFRMELAA